MLLILPFSRFFAYRVMAVLQFELEQIQESVLLYMKQNNFLHNVAFPGKRD